MLGNLARPVWGWGPGEIPGPTPLFAGSLAGGERNAGFMTLVSSAHRNDLDVWAYVNDVLQRLLAGETNYEPLCLGTGRCLIRSQSESTVRRNAATVRSASVKNEPNAAPRSSGRPDSSSAKAAAGGFVKTQPKTVLRDAYQGNFSAFSSTINAKPTGVHRKPNSGEVNSGSSGRNPVEVQVLSSALEARVSSNTAGNPFSLAYTQCTRPLLFGSTDDRRLPSITENFLT